MIDFVSTRPGVDAETRTAAQLLAFVIAGNVKLACQSLQRIEVQARRPCAEAVDALNYLFGQDSAFNVHAEAIGSSALAMRESMLGTRKLAMSGYFTELQRRNLQRRYDWWRYAQEVAPSSSDPSTATPVKG